MGEHLKGTKKSLMLLDHSTTIVTIVHAFGFSNKKQCNPKQKQLLIKIGCCCHYIGITLSISGSEGNALLTLVVFDRIF